MVSCGVGLESEKLKNEVEVAAVIAPFVAAEDASGTDISAARCVGLPFVGVAEALDFALVLACPLGLAAALGFAVVIAVPRNRQGNGRSPPSELHHPPI
ncbi:MAG TPA: hypothetical protein PK156_19115 [Polyangium sp.]|nr:hypothetical protein [Polyangium sp.]